LASLYIGQLNLREGKESVGFEPEALQILMDYDWPGNYDQRRYAAPVLDARAAFGRVCQELVVCEKYKENPDYRATLENAIHMIDLMRFVCGECDKVEAQARLATDAMHESLCTAQLSFENGSVGLLSTSRCAGAWAERIAMIGRDGDGNHVTAEIIMPLQLRIWRNGSLVEEKTYTAQDSGFI